ncbi:MFS transporter [Paenibacillus allorhizosphaerae]|uniref:Bacillibactin exporter n=1 Tax=Paenibacillus allorhizosphaerae TaxID=2849866 RepID=A0ABM8VDJ4_9BACL|nr:MFS transporter [Paenibacillus allorhizosphaerae]CAG7627989.1 Bacillibactin exporter [Paenibacillus allorhizosphaerae]
MQRKKHWELVAVCTVPLIMTLGNSMFIPVLPTMSKMLHVSPFQSSLLITVYSVVAIILIPIAGYLSDRFGRKKIMIPSLIIAGAGGIVSGLAALLLGDNAYTLILAGRLLQGVGAAGAAPIVLPLVGDMYNKESDVSSALGIVETSNTFGKVLSPIIGSLLTLLAWYAVFLAIPVFCALSVLLLAFLLKAPKQQGESGTFHEFYGSVKLIFKQKGRWLSAIFLVGAIGMFELFGLLFYLSETLEERYGFDGIVKGSLLAVPLSVLCLASYITGKTIGENKRLMKWLTVIGLLLLCLALVGLAWLHVRGLWGFFIFIAAGGLGIGIALPCLDAFITEGIEKEQRGTVSSIYSSMRFVGVAAGPPLVSLALTWTAPSLFYSLAAVSLLGVLTSLFAIQPKQASR